MFSTLLEVGLVAGLVALYLAPVRWALALVLAVVLLVPSGIVVPHSPSAQITIPRLAVAVFGLGMLAKNRQGLVTGAFRPTRMHFVLGAYLLGTFFVGVTLAGSQITTRAALRDWWSISEEVVFFAAVLAALRSLDLWWAARLATGLVLVTAGIAVIEHVTRHGYSAFWYRHFLNALPGGDRSVLSLQTRGGQVRVQAASLFALEFGWVSAMWLPLVTVVALWCRRRILFVGPAVVAVAIAWTYSRSVWSGLAAGALVLVVGSRADRKVVAAVLVAGLVTAAALVASPSLRAPYHAPDTVGSSRSRVTRAQLVAHAVAGHPYHGLGFGGLTQLGLRGTDVSYVLVYAELGVLGLVLIVLVFGTALGEGVASLRMPAGRERSLAAAAVSGIVLSAIAAGAYDFVGIEQSMLTVLFLTAFAVAVRERHVTAPSRRGRWFRMPARWALAIVAAGLVLGTALWWFAPRHWAGTWRIETVQARRLDEENSPGHEAFPGTLLRDTVCDLAHQAALARGNVTLACPQSFLNPLGAGIGDVRIQAPTRQEVDAVASDVFVPAARYLPGFGAQLIEPVTEGMPTWARTAPVSCGLLGLAAAVLLPPPRRRGGSRDTSGGVPSGGVPSGGVLSGGVMELGRPGLGLGQGTVAGPGPGRDGGVLEPFVPRGDEDPVRE
jgi:hypothetical protein